MNSSANPAPAQDTVCEAIRIRGVVQGVGFRPTVWRIARDLGVTGKVLNDGEGVLVHIRATPGDIEQFVENLHRHLPPLASIDAVERARIVDDGSLPDAFVIQASQGGPGLTAITADAATCPACIQDVMSPFDQRFRYPLTNCTHCGPRFSIVRAIPYDRDNTSMRPFAMCAACLGEYENPDDRRFHAQPNACHACGPRVTLERVDGDAVCLDGLSQLDAVDAACTVLQQGGILAVKGIGGFHLACDATNDEAVDTLRERKRRRDKPFALMARDVDVVRRYVKVDDAQARLLSSSEAPIVLLDRRDEPQLGTERTFGVSEGVRPSDHRPIADQVAPGQASLGFMLPYTPLHHLMLKRMNRPIVLTSGNVSDEPQIISNREVRERLAGIADYVLWHDRDILNRVDDSVVRVVRGTPRLLRRSRGYAPTPTRLPPGFEAAPNLLAMGGELKNTFCLLRGGNALLSQHIGDLENAATFADYEKNLELYARLFDHDPELLVIDAHPEYLSSKLGVEMSERRGVSLVSVQHHHAHVAACLAENQVPITAPPVLGVALDGLGYGGDGSLWGGEFLLADYRTATRLGTFKPVPMPGGTRAILEPWRNTYAHLMAEMGWDELKINFGDLELVRFLQRQPLDTLRAMMERGTNAPLASSCGRLFDAVAAALGICRERVSFEGQAAMQLESLVDVDALCAEDELLDYPFAIPNLADGLPYIEPLAMWQALLGDLILDTPAPLIAARFHRGLAGAIVRMVVKLTTRDGERGCNTVALTGGVFQNRVLFELVEEKLRAADYRVLSHQHVPANDGGIALGQAVIAAACHIQPRGG